jgi:hypothetical protein
MKIYFFLVIDNIGTVTGCNRLVGFVIVSEEACAIFCVRSVQIPAISIS